jgi:hypothetical protein
MFGWRAENQSSNESIDAGISSPDGAVAFDNVNLAATTGMDIFRGDGRRRDRDRHGHARVSVSAAGAKGLATRVDVVYSRECGPFGIPSTSHWTGAAIIAQ